MTKSRTLMIAYVLFLLFSAALCSITENDTIEIIAFAATCAGYFFAMADAAECISSAHKSTLQLERDQLLSHIKYIERLKQLTNKNIENAHTVEKCLQRFGDDEWEQSRKNLLKVINEAGERERRLTILLDELNTQEEKMEKGSRKGKRLDIICSVCMIIGFFVFLVILVFEEFARYVFVAEDSITVGAFAVIVFTYCSREWIGEAIERTQNSISASFEELESKLSREVDESQPLIDMGIKAIHYASSCERSGAIGDDE